MGPHRVGPLWPWLVVLSLVVPLGSCSPECEKAPETAPGPAAADELMIHVSHNKLDPTEVSVSVGDTVTFHNLVEMPGARQRRVSRFFSDKTYGGGKAALREAEVYLRQELIRGQYWARLRANEERRRKMGSAGRLRPGQHHRAL